MTQLLTLQLLVQLELLLSFFIVVCQGAMPLRVLLLGGNGMLGGETAKLLVDAGHQVHILNRGNWYHDSETRIKPFVKHIKCDRKYITSCGALSKEDYFDVVVDFSSYMPGVLSDFLNHMRGKFGLFIYISSDSVYEVCQRAQHAGLAIETDSIRPTELDERKKLNQADSYGHNKLACEEVLEELYQQHDFNYIALRLPDVIGPRDNTNRFWYYFLWTLVHKEIDFPLMIPTWLASQPLSFVYSLDVARLITGTLLKPTPEILNQPFNLAFSEILTLQEFLTLIGNSVDIDTVSFIEGGSEYYLPSVTRGPINCTKASHSFDWKATPILNAVNESMDFYKSSLENPQFAALVKTIIADLEVNLIPQEKSGLFRKELKKRTVHASFPKEEL